LEGGQGLTGKRYTGEQWDERGKKAVIGGKTHPAGLIVVKGEKKDKNRKDESTESKNSRRRGRLEKG